MAAEQQNNALVPIGQVAGDVTRHEFGVQQMEKRAETASTAVAAREQAAVQARFIMAERNPRQIEKFRLSMIDECKRPTFAAVARYGKPVGKEKNAQGQWVEKKVYGPSIRFIEAAIRNFRNLAPEVFTVFDSPTLRIVRVTVTDLEANICYANEIQVEKHVERKGKQQGNKTVAPEGREVLGERVNSYGDPVYIVRATEDEVLVKQNSLVSKAIRTQAQRLLPGDIVEECMDVVVRVQKTADAEDPAASLRKILDAFHDLNVEPSDLERWAGKALDRLQPKEMQELRAIYTSIKEGETTWDEIVAAGEGEGGSKDEQKNAAAEKLASLRPKKDTKPTTENGSDKNPGTVATESGSGETEARQSAGTTSEIPHTPSRGTELSRHISDLRAWREQLGGEAFATILGAHGYEAINDVPVEKFPPIQEALAQAAQDRSAKAQGDAPKDPKLRFGGKK